MKNQKCTSCGKELDAKGIVFSCPRCQKPLARCSHCRKLTILYKCECGFEGP